MPSIDETWLRTAFNAMQEMLDVDSRTRNEMIQFLMDEGFWPAANFKSFDTAVQKWNACKHPQKAEFFKVGELWALALRFNRHHLFLRVLADLGYETPRLRPTEERRLELLERLAAQNEHHANFHQQVYAELARLVPPMLEAQSPRGPRPSFSLGEGSAPDTAVERVGCP